MKKQMLSILAKDYTKKQLQEMIPDLTVYSIDQARLHTSVHGEGSQVPKQIKQHRQRLSQWKVAHALDFFFNPLFHQVSSYGTKEMKLNSGEKILIPEVVRPVCHANLVHMYEAFCKESDESDVDPLSRSSLFEDIPVELKLELLNDIEVGVCNILSWKQHLVRCANQDRCRLGSLKKEEVFIIMDWAMKFLPLSFREKQSDWYAPKGINWHLKQDWFAVVSVLEHTSNTVKKQLPCITSAYLRSDNAGCYHCGNTWLSLDGISERTGITIKRYDFSEAQDGKSYCDAKIVHLRCKIRQYVSSGNDVKTAGDMKNAIDSLGGVMGCQAAHVQINYEVAGEATKIKNTWKGISKISNIELREQQIIAFKAYEVGSGNVVSEEQIKKICPSPLSSTEIVVLADFVVPKKETGSISYKAQDLVPDNVNVELPVESSETIQPSSNVFSCIEPCSLRVFQTYSGLESHTILGNHQINLNQCSAYDTIKIKWKESCLNIAKHATVSRDSQLTLGTPSSDMGWAIKKERKNTKYF
ncbi:unnamed protein product [Mytilus coruscus]|uniref:C2H2-type domain-containing protein n=1 Tax=Mytilus coruscus TaxID=42192 RepID=A0A6J8B1D1_MYTCO|nr:unnamed protein product [Mytilus coruscus]